MSIHFWFFYLKTQNLIHDPTLVVLMKVYFKNTKTQFFNTKVSSKNVVKLDVRC